MRGILCLTVLLGVTATPATAQTTGITGTWVLDPARSDKPLFDPPTHLAASAVIGLADANDGTAAPEATVSAEASTLTIAEGTNDVTVMRTVEESVTASFGGSESVTSLSGTTTRARAWRENGSTIVLTTKAVQLPGGVISEVRVTERFARSQDGTLIHDRTVENGGQTRTWHFVYQAAK